MDEIRKRWIQENDDFIKAMIMPKDIKAINFAPPDGYCDFCKRDIALYYGEEYGKTVITGCPFCHMSYCE